MTGDPKWLYQYKLSLDRDQIFNVNGSQIFVARKESMSLLNKFHVYDVLHVFDLSLNLLSGNKITKN